MRDWRKAKKAGEASLDRYDVEKECNYDMACVRRVWEHLSLSGLGLARLDRRPWSWARRPWRKARKSGETSLDRGAPAAQFLKECNYDMACTRRKMDTGT